MELDQGRGSGGFGPATIGYTDVLAWSHLSGTFPSPGEVRLLLLIDKSYLSEMGRLRELQRPQAPPSSSPRSRKR